MKFPQEINASLFTLTTAVFLALPYNFSFWNRFFEVTGGIRFSAIPLYIATFLILIAIFNLFLTLAAFSPIIKPAVIALFFATAISVYFMHQYGTVIDASMMQNVFETDTREMAELVNWRMVMTLFLLGVLPSLAVWRAKLHFSSLPRDLWNKLGIVIVCSVVAVSLLLVFYKSFAPMFREHRELRFLLTPTNYIQATLLLIRRKFDKPLTVALLGTDAIKGPLWRGATRKTVVVMVVGETARAANFSLNGYARDTNPELSKQTGLINFNEVYSCGTATAVSVPCVFSALGRKDYSETKAKSQQGLLDVLAHAGFSVLWRDNNSGCKNTCDRVQYEDVSRPIPGEPLCTAEECYDERLLQKLPEIIRNSRNDLVIVLHQKGSHGPAYWKRYPKPFQRFTPVCSTNNLEECSTESIIAAYDNSILYTDHFLSEAIDILRKSSEQDQVDASLIYFSDHGESLGEKGVYLHGMPYLISPIEQRHVPFMLWLSESFRTRFRIDAQCLAARAHQSFSHDNVFHSTLGMLNVNTAVYNPGLDIFQPCTYRNLKTVGFTQ